MRKKILHELKNLSRKMIIAIILTLTVIGTAWIAIAAFTEPTSGPAASVQDFAKNILGANNADNGFDSSAVVANADGSLIERTESIQTTLASSSTIHGCYRKTCSVHNATSCTPTACGGGETDKGTNCPQEGGLWNAQTNSQSYTALSAAYSWNTFYYGSKFSADYYVTCERWCCM